MEKETDLDQLSFVSGGQTGIDRALLDFCLEHHYRCGGWCPGDRSAEDGPIDSRYPVKPLPGASNDDRTRANVEMSDATIIIYFRDLKGGTLKSYDHVLERGKPCLLLDMSRVPLEEAALSIIGFIRRYQPETVNFSGPRKSEWENGYDHCMMLLESVLRQI